MTLSLIAVPTSSRRRVIGPTSKRAFRAEPLWISTLDRNFRGIIDLDQSDTIDFDRHLPGTTLPPLSPIICSNRPAVCSASRMMIVEDIHKALDAGHIRHAAELSISQDNSTRRRCGARR
jgi:hypothetical protein